jgi:hypothetical protein
MGNVNCVQSRRSSISISLEDVYLENIRVNNKSTGKTSDRREVASQNVVNNFVQPSDEDLSSNSCVASNFQTLESRDSTTVPVNAINTIPQENTPSPALYSKLVAKLPKNSDFKLKKFIDNKDHNPLEYLKQNQEQLIKAFNIAISKDPELNSAYISINIKCPSTENFPEFSGKPILTFEGDVAECIDVTTYDNKKGKFGVKKSRMIHHITQHIDLSRPLAQSKNLADFVTNMRLEATFIVLSAKINSAARGFDVGIISPFAERPLEDFFTSDMKSFLPAEIIRAKQAELSEKFAGSGIDLPDSFGCYSVPIDNSRKINYV